MTEEPPREFLALCKRISEGGERERAAAMYRAFMKSQARVEAIQVLRGVHRPERTVTEGNPDREPGEESDV